MHFPHKPLGIKQFLILSSAEQPSEKDPLCRMRDHPATASVRLEHVGKTCHCNCGHWLGKFRPDPGNYLSANRAGPFINPDFQQEKRKTPAEERLGKVSFAFSNPRLTEALFRCIGKGG